MGANKPPRVMRINPKNGAVKLYRTTGEAARDLGLDSVVVANACARRLGMKMYGGYMWSYTADGQPKTPGPFAGREHTDETKELMSRAKDAKKKRVLAYDTNGQFIAGYDSQMPAARAVMGKASAHSQILGAIKRGGTAYGRIWKRMA